MMFDYTYLDSLLYVYLQDYKIKWLFLSHFILSFHKTNKKNFIS